MLQDHLIGGSNRPPQKPKINHLLFSFAYLIANGSHSMRRIVALCFALAQEACQLCCLSPKCPSDQRAKPRGRFQNQKANVETKGQKQRAKGSFTRNEEIEGCSYPETSKGQNQRAEVPFAPKGKGSAKGQGQTKGRQRADPKGRSLFLQI